MASYMVVLVTIFTESMEAGFFGGAFVNVWAGVILSFWESLLASREWKHSSVLRTALPHPVRVFSHCQEFKLESLPTWICELTVIL